MDKLLSKEDILRQMFEKGSPFYNQQDIMVAMDTYAKQTSIAFYNWMEKENTIWLNEQGEPLTDDELYEIFYQSQNNIHHERHN